MESKICTKCNTNKLFSEFNKDKNTKNGLTYYCKECLNNIKKEYYLKNKEKILEQIVCSCGCVTSKSSLLRHQKSKKHIELMKEKEEN